MHVITRRTYVWSGGNYCILVGYGSVKSISSHCESRLVAIETVKVCRVRQLMLSDAGMEEPLCFASERRKFAVEGIGGAFREERSEFTINAFIGQVIRDEKDAGVPAPGCERLEIIPVEGQDEPFFLVCKLVDIWIRHTYDMEIISNMFQVITTVQSWELGAGRHVLI
jgi:hypothetical protein